MLLESNRCQRRALVSSQFLSREGPKLYLNGLNRCFYDAKVTAAPPRPTPTNTDCSNFDGMDTCKGSEVNYPAEVDNRKFQSPPKGAETYQESYGDYSHIAGYAQVSYNPSRTSATVRVVAFARSDSKLAYQFNDNSPTSENSLTVDTSLKKDLIITIHDKAENKKLVLDPINFVWQSSPVKSPYGYDGSKGGIIDLFGWPYKDIAKECETHLGKAGWLGIKIQPPQEHVISDFYPQNGELNPWYFHYQPVSYKLQSRAGNRQELRNMIETCRNNGIRVYADAVINHMSGGGNDIEQHRRSSGGSCIRWGPKNGTAGSPFFTHSWTFQVNPFTGQRPALEFPAVPYFPSHFHCDRVMNDWKDPLILSAGWLAGLSDLHTGLEYVQDRIASYLVDLIGIGFSGFRIDAAKHIKPAELAQILAKTRNFLGGNYPNDFMAFSEVILGGEKDLLACADGEYNFYVNLDRQYKLNGIDDKDIAKLLIWSSDYPKEHPICGRWVLPSSRFLIQNDDHDQQKSGSSSRDMGDKGSVLLVDRDIEKHRRFQTQLFSRTDGDWKYRLVFSGYTFMGNGASGWPDGRSDCSIFQGTKEPCTKSVPYSPAYDSKSCGYDCFKGGKWQEGAYTRVHRDKDIIRAMRSWMGLSGQAPNVQLGLPETC
ncbi:glycoside hydrolase superfamily [Paraphysoderma sedebokerense]|nr:glycoside hydrolase superfamily [Paraphysoderma sedebokerense]